MKCIVPKRIVVLHLWVFILNKLNILYNYSVMDSNLALHSKDSGLNSCCSPVLSKPTLHFLPVVCSGFHFPVVFSGFHFPTILAMADPFT